MGSLKWSQETGTSGAINWSKRRDTMQLSQDYRIAPLNELIDLVPSWMEIRFPSKI